LPGLNEAELLSWQEFTEASTRLYAALNSELVNTFGLTLLDVMLLRLVANADKGSARMGGLAHALAVSPSRVSQRAQRLESEGLLRRNKSPDDRRVVMATITPHGRTVLKPALTTYAKGVRSLYLNRLSRREMAALGDSCRRVGDPLGEPQPPE
jgi:DNA-binding MarR family transcriptional regulator